MIKQTPRYQQMEKVFEQVLKLKQELQQLSSHQDERTPQWQAVELRIETVNQLIEALQKTEELVEEEFSVVDWQAWRTLVTAVQQDHQRALQLLTIKKEKFYQEVQAVGRSVKANRAYNEMKRIRY